MRFAGTVSVLLLVLALFFPGAAGYADSLPPEGEPQDQVGDALSRARDSLREAMDALTEAGRLTLDHQLPKLKEQTDKTLKSTQNLLNQWEEQLRQELNNHKEKKDSDLSPLVPDEEQGRREVMPSI
ncbi:MAG: hypothetical protein HQL80_07590 [Magnetococcales bacterium]|nr:hypothetical protein [Magnetococcales bacterium]